MSPKGLTGEIDVGQLGEVFTRRWVVELILDLAGYTPDKDLASAVAVEPACGSGAFLVPMTERLAESCRLHDRALGDAAAAVRAFDLRPENAERARCAVAVSLMRAGLVEQEAVDLARRWVTVGDFLLQEHDGDAADFVLGNPPYVRLEHLHPDRLGAYRRACPTMRGRSDVFVGFLERGLRMLRTGGALGFIVADRWMRNQYGGALRRFVADGFAVEAVVEMHDVDAFHDDVAAYPAVTVIRRRRQARPAVASTTRAFGASDAAALRDWASRPSAGPLVRPSVRAARLPQWFAGDQPWPSATPSELALLADIERRCPPLGGRVHGNPCRHRPGDGSRRRLPHEGHGRGGTRASPAAGDGQGHRVGRGALVRHPPGQPINPWDDDGLVRLDEWPRLQAYLERHGARLQQRHTARRAPDRWHRTIDRVTPGLQHRPKLLLPELKAFAHPVLDEGRLYPHHNLYHVTSSGWDLPVLGGLLLSGITNLFVGAYCVRMRGGTYRFQAQYLRRIRVPELASVRAADRRALATAFHQRDVEAATAVAARLYGVAREAVAGVPAAEVA